MVCSYRVIDNMSLYKMFKNEGESVLFKNLKEGIEDIKYGRVTKATTVDDFFTEMEEERIKHRVWYWFYGKYWRAYYIITDIPRQIRTFVQRGRRGVGESDIWNLHGYISKVMVEGIKWIKENGMGIPTWDGKKTEKEAVREWKEILDTLIWTFEIAQKISDGDVHYLRKARDRKTWEKLCERLCKKYPDYENRVMTREEIVKYDRGWKLFKEYYFALWD